MCPQSAESSNFGNFGMHLGVPRQNNIWVLVSWLNTKYNIMGKVVVSPKSRPWWVLWVCVFSWFVRAPKCSSYALTNLLFGLWNSVLMIELLVNSPSPHPELQTAPLPLNAASQGVRPNFFSFRYFSPLDLWWVHQRACGCIIKDCWALCSAIIGPYFSWQIIFIP
jgi:hypothetical protein